MIKKELTIKNKQGLHARPASLLVRTLSKFKSDVFLAKDGIRVNGKSIMGVMMLAAERGSKLEVEINGEDEELAFKALADLIENNFYED
jgi:phosphotransferase system HPr (HPr) family protein